MKPAVKYILNTFDLRQNLQITAFEEDQLTFTDLKFYNVNVYRKSDNVEHSTFLFFRQLKIIITEVLKDL